MDDIGLGQALANLWYLIILAVALIGCSLFLIFKKKLFVLWWFSAMLNLFSFSYFLGDSTLIGYSIRLFSITVWPLANIVFLIYSILKRHKLVWDKNRQK
jgi:hypothetical protein